jgi:tellurite resistance protein/uncharacterized protein (DUF697 family)
MSTMTADEMRAVVSVAVMAAFADGRKHEREREELRRIADGLAQDEAVHLPSLVQDVLMGRVSLASVAPRLRADTARQLAYEMAVCVCDADGAQSAAERDFLRALAQALGLDAGAADLYVAQAEAIASAPMEPATSGGAGPAAATAAGVSAGAAALTAAATDAVAVSRPAVDEAALDRMILNAAILNGAIELLPESLSTLAIIPLQMRLVYRVGQTYGYALDSGHIRDFLATVGVGLTSQYLEQAGRKLLGGLLGKVGGGLLAGVGRQAVSSGMSFVTTYALGHVARRYYAGGRVWTTAMLKDAYQDMTRQAQGLQQRHLPEIRERARGLDAAKVMALVRGGPAA